MRISKLYLWFRWLRGPEFVWWNPDENSIAAESLARVKYDLRSRKIHANMAIDGKQRFLNVDSDWLYPWKGTKRLMANCNQCRMRVEVCIRDEAFVIELHLLKCLRSDGVLERCEKSTAKSTNY